MNPWAQAVDQCENAALLSNTLSTYVVLNGRIRPSTAATDAVASENSDQLRANGYVEVTVAGLTTGSDYVGCSLRILSSTQFYAIFIDGSGFLEIGRWAGGPSFTNLASVSTTLPAVPFTIAGDMVDDKIRAFINGQVILSVSDSTYSGPGKWGTYAYATTTTTNVLIERFEAGPGPYQPAPWSRPAL